LRVGVDAHLLHRRVELLDVVVVDLVRGLDDPVSAYFALAASCAARTPAISA
jgi:hypothetical protein